MSFNWQLLKKKGKIVDKTDWFFSKEMYVDEDTYILEEYMLVKTVSLCLIHTPKTKLVLDLWFY